MHRLRASSQKKIASAITTYNFCKAALGANAAEVSNFAAGAAGLLDRKGDFAGVKK